VPPVAAPATTTPGEQVIRSSGNLEEIANSLTKILVGLGLVELGTIISSGKRFVHWLEPAFGGEPSGEAFALADIAFFAVDGCDARDGLIFARARETQRDTKNGAATGRYSSNAYFETLPGLRGVLAPARLIAARLVPKRRLSAD
jgi:hypothetical protein